MSSHGRAVSDIIKEQSTVTVPAPVTGIVDEVLVLAGEEIKSGTPLGVLSFLKTESRIFAPIGGRVKIIVQEDEELNAGETFAEIVTED